MPIIAILNTKGGSGKTTLTTNLSHALKQTSGHNVRLIDSDPQGSASDWHAAGGKELLSVTRVTRASLDRDLAETIKPDEWLLIDGAPRADELAAAAIRAADVVLIPAQPSPYDVWAAKPLVKAIKFHQSQNNGLPKAAFVISRAIVGTALAKNVRQILAEYDMPVFESMTHQRVIYAETAATGQTVVEDPNTKAAIEIDSIRRELEDFLRLSPPTENQSQEDLKPAEILANDLAPTWQNN